VTSSEHAHSTLSTKKASGVTTICYTCWCCYVSAFENMHIHVKSYWLFQRRFNVSTILCIFKINWRSPFLPKWKISQMRGFLRRNMYSDLKLKLIICKHVNKPFYNTLLYNANLCVKQIVQMDRPCLKRLGRLEFGPQWNNSLNLETIFLPVNTQLCTVKTWDLYLSKNTHQNEWQ